MQLETPFQVRDGIHARQIRKLAPDDIPLIDFGAIYAPSVAERQSLGPFSTQTP